MKYPIIGREEDLKNITLEDIKEFYKKYYCPLNTSIAIVSRLDESRVIEILEKYFSLWKLTSVNNKLESNELPQNGVYKEYKEGIKNARIEIIFPLNELTERACAAFRIFNEFFGEGVNSVLFDELRTKNGLVYDVLTNIACEKHINLYKITFATSKDKVTSALEILNKAITREYIINEEEIKGFIKAINRKKLFKEEQGIYLAKELSINAVMKKEFTIYDDITIEEIKSVKDKVLKNQSIQIIIPKEVI
jgi:predicted Zn-dependent peptidase